jgi:uncharacterized membrane protein HdeD (DUF308 family)
MIYELINSLGGVVLFFTGLIIRNDFLLVFSGLTLFIVAVLFLTDRYKLLQQILQHLPVSYYSLGIKSVVVAFLFLYFSILTEDFIKALSGTILLLFGSSFLFSKDEKESEEQSVEAKSISGIVLALVGFLVALLTEAPFNYIGFLILFTGEGLILEYSPPTGEITESSRFLPGFMYGLAGIVILIFGLAQLILFIDPKTFFLIILGLIFALTGIYLIRSSSESKLLPPIEEIKNGLEE